MSRPLISLLLADRRLCLACLAGKTSTTPEAVATALEVLGRALTIRRHAGGTCDACGMHGDVVVME